MVYRNGIKEYASITLIFGILLGLLYGLPSASIVKGIIVGVVGGLSFALLLFLFMKNVEKKFNKKREEISKERNIICDGGVTMGSVGGWMFLTEKGLEFYPHKVNFTKAELTIPMHKIASVETIKNRINVYTTDEQAYVIIVSHNKEWKKQIDDCIKG